MEHGSAPSGITVGRREDPELTVKVVNIRVCILSRKYRVVGGYCRLDGPGFFSARCVLNLYFHILRQIHLAAIGKCLAIHSNLRNSVQFQSYRKLCNISRFSYIWSQYILLSIYHCNNCCMIICSLIIGRLVLCRRRSYNCSVYHRKCTYEVTCLFLHFLSGQRIVANCHIVNQAFEIFSASPICFTNLKNTGIAENSINPITACYF